MSIASEIQRLKTAKADIKAAIEEKGVVVGDGTIDTYAEKISEISGGSGGNPLEYVNDMSDTYYGITFPDGYELTIDLPNVTSLNSAFYSAKGIKKVTIKGNTAGNEVVFNRAFRGSSLETIDLTAFNAKCSGDMTFAFYHSANLIEILGELDFSNVTTNLSGNSGAFVGCSKLVTITPKPNSIKISIRFSESSLLSDLSIQSIIDGLADLTGGTAQTLTLHSTVGSKLTDTQKAAITAKNWTLVY